MHCSVLFVVDEVGPRNPLCSLVPGSEIEHERHLSATTAEKKKSCVSDHQFNLVDHSLCMGIVHVLCLISELLQMYNFIHTVFKNRTCVIVSYI